jgi:hypothetical protein
MNPDVAKVEVLGPPMIIERLADIVTETKTPSFDWALIPNHAHHFLRTGRTALTVPQNHPKNWLSRNHR